jgi:hypothetical protein
MKEITHFNLKFGIDTSDWNNDEDADHCSDLIETMVCEWDELTTRQNHQVLLDADSELIDFDAPEVTVISNQASACAHTILSEYEGPVTLGHNAFLSAH